MKNMFIFSSTYISNWPPLRLRPSSVSFNESQEQLDGRQHRMHHDCMTAGCHPSRPPLPRSPTMSTRVKQSLRISDNCKSAQVPVSRLPVSCGVRLAPSEQRKDPVAGERQSGCWQ